MTITVGHAPWSSSQDLLSSSGGRKWSRNGMASSSGMVSPDVGYRRQVEKHKLGIVLTQHLQLRLFANSRTVACGKELAVQRRLAPQHLEPGMTARLQSVGDHLPGLE